MGMIDDMKDKMSDWSEEMKARYNELRDKDDNGILNNDERSELQKMRDRLRGDE